MLRKDLIGGSDVIEPHQVVYAMIGARSRCGACRLLHLNVYVTSTAAWTLQQLREALGYEDGYRYLVPDRDSIFAKSLDESIERLRLKVLTSPARSPMANE